MAYRTVVIYFLKLYGAFPSIIRYNGQSKPCVRLAIENNPQ